MTRKMSVSVIVLLELTSFLTFLLFFQLLIFSCLFSIFSESLFFSMNFHNSNFNFRTFSRLKMKFKNFITLQVFYRNPEQFRNEKITFLENHNQLATESCPNIFQNRKKLTRHKLQLEAIWPSPGPSLVPSPPDRK